MKIIKLSSRDCDFYCEKLSQYIYENLTNSAFEVPYTYQEAIEKYGELKGALQEKKAIAYAAIKDNGLIGFVWAYKCPFRDDENRIYVNILYVALEYRSQGIGSRLLRKIEDEARELGYSAVFLHIEAYNDGNFRFYDKMGYQKERVQLAKKLDNNFPKKDIIAKVKTWNYKDEDVKIQQVDSGFVFLNLAELASMYLENVLTHILMDSFSYQDAVKKMENLAAYLDEKKAYTYCYCIADKIAGIVWTYPYKFKEEERLYIGEIQVNAKYRGKKIGHHLYSKIIEKMEEMGIKTLYTHVDAINMASLGFHRTQGFEDEVYQMAKRVNLEKII